MKIALSGIAGSGKDYFASHLIKKGFARISYSDQLKKIGANIFDWLEKDYPPEVKEKPLNITTETGEVIEKTPREIWLNLNKLREIENQLFIRMLGKELSLTKVEDIVISDIRTKEEFDYAKRKGFTTIFIEPEKEKVMHKENEFDKQIYDFKDEYDFIFKNSFNGTDDFDYFFRNIVK